MSSTPEIFQNFEIKRNTRDKIHTSVGKGEGIDTVRKGREGVDSCKISAWSQESNYFPHQGIKGSEDEDYPTKRKKAG